jgi:nucleotide-binding universal stress UspA family protein
MFTQVLVAVDGSVTGNHGLKAAIGLAADQKAALTVLHVVDDMASVSYVGDLGYVPSGFVDKVLDELRANGRKILAKAEALARERGVEAQALLVETKGSSVADAILAQARKVHADLIVLGTHGRRGLRRVVMGSDAEAVLRDARVPVLLVRTAERSSSTTPRATGGATRSTAEGRKRGTAKASAET